MDFRIFMGNLKTHELEIKAREEQESQKKKSVAFKVSPGSTNDEEEPDEEEIISMIMRESRIDVLQKGTIR